MFLAKLDALITLIEKWYNTKKMLIFAHFHSTCDLIEQVLNYKKFQFLRYDGKMTGSARNAVIEKFQAKDSNSRILLATTGAGGTGINCQAASLVFLFEPEESAVAEEQAVCRYSMKLFH